jgi:ferredoxin
MRRASHYARFVSLVVATILALPLPYGAVTGLYLWTSPVLMINMALAQRALVVLHVLAFAVLAAMFLRHRWYCLWLCPAGVLCDAASNSRTSTVRLNRVPDFHKMLLIAGWVTALLGVPLLSMLDPLSIFHAFFDAFRKQPAGIIVVKLSGLSLIIAMNFMAPHIWCRKLCPLGGLQDVATSAKQFVAKKTVVKPPFQASRRFALGALGGVGLNLLVRQIAGTAPAAALRPPGALPGDNFKAVCLRCGNCGKACPTGIIRSSHDSSDMLGLLTPYVQFDTGYCLPECTLCGYVCPSGAIRRFTQSDKLRLVMGIVRIHVERCLLTEHKECDLCKSYCDYEAVAIRLSDTDLSAWPEIIEDRCVGCGACVVVCPVKVIDITPK